jgi:transcriptional regulator with XRE-family HTH domain
MRFGEKARALPAAKNLSLRAPGRLAGVSFAYVSKIENGRCDRGDYPSADLIGRLAAALDADGEELLLLAGKIPVPIRRRVLGRPDASRTIARPDNERLDRVLESIEAE